MYCKKCGKELSEQAVACVACGVPVHGISSAVKAKSKTTAVLLAVFLGFWTWCYTYKKDAWKFWVNICLFVVTVSIWGIVAWIWAVIDAVRRPEEFYSNFNQSVFVQTPSSSTQVMPPTIINVVQPVVQTVPFKKNKLSTNKKVILIVTIIYVPIVLLLIMAWFGNTDYFSWDYAQRENTVKAYEAYLKEHPEGSHASEARSSLATLTDADNKLREVCSGRGAQEAAIFTASNFFHPITVYRLEDGHLLNIDGTIPREWRPLSVKDCELVACVEEQKKVIVQTCRYTGGFESTRYQFQTRVVLRAARTGKVVAENLFTGSEPPQCPVSITKGSPFNIRTREGTEVNFRDIKGWLKGHVNPREER